MSNEYTELGSENGHTCNRYPEPDEDQPRGYRPRPCNGEMVEVFCRNTGESWIECDTCGEIAQ